jgi:glycosyltransferase involved in cell wall biosynthesis
MTSAMDSEFGGSRHVLMLLNNPCINDSRVIKEAEALVGSGWKVTVLCRHDRNLPQVDIIRGVVYQRLEPLPRDLRSLTCLLRAYLPGNPRGLFSVSIADEGSTKPIVRTVQTWRTFRDALHALPDSSAKRVLQSVRRTTTRVLQSVRRTTTRVLQSVRRTTAPVLRKSFQVLSYPLRSFYWYHESDEFRNIVYRHAVQLRPNVVHCHDLATLPAGVAISKACGCKLVYDSHELEMHRNAKYPEATMRKRRKLEQIGITRADAVITVSESIADHLRDDYRIRRPHVVMNAPDFDEHEHPTRTVRDDLRLSPDTPLAVYVGSVTVNRGLDYVVKALNHYPELHFATVGPRRPATQAELHELAVKLRVDGRLHFVDPVPPSAVVGYISTSDVSVLPIQNVCLSYYYCMPNKLLESVFAGIPVAVADLFEMRRFVEAFQCGLVMDEKSPNSIADAIESIVKNRNRFIVCDKIRQQINDKYSWTAQAHKLLLLYEGLFALQPPPSLATR